MYYNFFVLEGKGLFTIKTQKNEWQIETTVITSLHVVHFFYFHFVHLHKNK